jgi:hypothetical protein
LRSIRWGGIEALRAQSSKLKAERKVKEKTFGVPITIRIVSNNS